MKKLTIAALVTAGCALAACATVMAQARSVAAEPPAALAPDIAPPAGTLWVIFVDDLHLDFRNTGRLRTLLKTIASELILDGDTFGIVSSGPSSLAIDRTSDRQQLEAAIKKVAGNGLKPSDILPAGTPAVENGEVRYRVAVALGTAYDVMKSLARLQDQRKVFIYVTNGYLVAPSPEGGAAPVDADLFAVPRFVPGVVPGPDPSVTRLRDQLAALPRVAAAAAVTIFAIDPRSLDPTGLYDPYAPDFDWSGYVTTTQNNLRAISEQTGGFALLDLSDPVEALKRISAAVRQ